MSHCANQLLSHATPEKGLGLIGWALIIAGVLLTFNQQTPFINFLSQHYSSSMQYSSNNVGEGSAYVLNAVNTTSF